MLHDYPQFKRRVRNELMLIVRSLVGQVEPILADIRHQTLHEGRTAHLTRADASEQKIEFNVGHAELAIPAEQMKGISHEQLFAHLLGLAKQLAEHQARMMFSVLDRVTSETGNVVSARELGDKEAFLEMERRIQMDFDPDSLQPRDGYKFVIHPSQRERIEKLGKELELDEEFQKELKAIRELKLEEWRARESARTLVD